MSDAPTLCPSCKKPDCDGIIGNHTIRMGKFGYPFVGCKTQALILQERETNMRSASRAETVESYRRLSGIPPLFERKGFAEFQVTFDNGAGLKAGQRFVKEIDSRREHGRGLLLTGPTGTGKTHLGCATLSGAIDRGVRGRYVYMPKLLDLLRARGGEETLIHSTYQELYETPIVMLDELGLDSETDWRISVYTKILNERYQQQRPTIITTNLDLKQLDQAVGARGRSRILETYEIVQISGPDYRVKARKA